MSNYDSDAGAVVDTPLQFDTAHAGDVAAATAATCASCSAPIHSEYYEANGSVVCADCRGKLAVMTTSTGGMRRFRRALGFGLAAAIAGALCYYAFRELTGIDFGLVAVLVGFMVGKAVFVGGERRGGRRYQVLAVVLTYFAMASTYLPIALSELREGRTVASDSTKAAARGKSAVVARDSVSVATPTDSATAPKASKATAEKVGFGTFLIALGAMVLFTAALPIIVGFSSIISVVILGVGLMQAWRMNRAVVINVTGPYRLAGAAMDDVAT
jgi:hypothetical protein